MSGECFTPSSHQTLLTSWVDSLCGSLSHRRSRLPEHYDFTEEELDFIINYDIKYRMGDELNDNE